MKNIHLLPTQNNKSKLALYHYDGSKNIKVGEIALQINNNLGWTNCWSPRELYITSEEKIKDKDWCLDIDNEIVKYCEKKYNMLFHNVCKKIILTTDENLIKDRVQAIDNEFLEWFLKNSSCENVEIDFSLGSGSFKYKIIIPQQEYISPVRPFKVKEDRSETMQRFIDNAKSHSFCETPEEKCTMNYCDDNGCMNRKRELVEPKEMLVKMMQDDEELGLYEEPSIIDKRLEEKGTPEIANQVEEEAENYVRNHPDFEAEGFSEYQNGVFNGFIEGAKWQQDNNYSEEEVLDLLNKREQYLIETIGEFYQSNLEWFEQFKKKQLRNETGSL